MAKDESNLTTYQIYLMLFGYLSERNDTATYMLRIMLTELYKRADRADKSERMISF